MAIYMVKCPSCGSATELNDEKDFCFCTECGKKILASEAELYAPADDPTPADSPMPVPEAEVYEMADGTSFPATYFFHARMWDKPGPRDEAKAKALVADLVEDYFCTFNGERNMVGSQYISIS